MESKRNPMLKRLSVPVLRAFGPERGGALLEDADRRFEALCRENAEEPKAVKRLTHTDLYPTLALYQSVLAEGKLSRAEAARFLYDARAEAAEPDAESLRKAMRIPGAYHLMPAAFRLMTHLKFGPKAGFRFHFYPVGFSRVKFDMLRCPYCEICGRYGCPELVVAFCHTDDVTNERMHPRLHWHRTQTLGGGGEKCDFQLFIE